MSKFTTEGRGTDAKISEINTTHGIILGGALRHSNAVLIGSQRVFLVMTKVSVDPPDMASRLPSLPVL